MHRLIYFILLGFLTINSCKGKSDNSETTVDKKQKITAVKDKENNIETIPISPKEEPKISKENPTNVAEKPLDKKPIKSVENFQELSTKQGVLVDIKYATKDNFTKKQIYPCGRCYLRPIAADAINKAQKILQTKYKYSFKMFDCYRPRPAQQRLWDVVPNPDYVTPPSKGSMHNKGLAVDLTIVDENGRDLDMGTPYDFFGKEAHTDNLSLPKNVLANRTLLTNVMKEVGFKGIRTEWWHFSYETSAALSDWEWSCK